MPSASSADRELHRRLLEADPVTTAELAEQYLGPLLKGLARAFPRVDDAILCDVAVELVLALAKQPEKYDPDRLGLQAYLRMDAKGDVLNRIEKEQKRTSRLMLLPSVELSPQPLNTQQKRLDDLLFPDDEFELPPGLTRAAALMELRRALPNETDRQALMLMLDGERRTPVFAGVWELGRLDEPSQRRAVKKNKDRVRKMLERLRRRLLSRRAPAPVGDQEGRDATR